jgi:diguanylate cyclase (GGDEF)-like protein/PAS domain S-box-containing protein
MERTRGPSALPLVLVVDDDPGMRLLIGESLQAAGFAIAEADDGLPSLAAFEQLRPDVVLLDVNMGDLDGFAVCTAMRAMNGGDRVPIVMVTGLDDVASINRAYEVGATDFVTKPINWAVLGHRVRYILRASQAFDELRRNQDSLAKAQRIARLGNWDWDVDNDRFSWSGEVYDGMGMAHDALDATYEAFMRWTHPDDRTLVRTAFDAARDGGTPLDIEHRIVLRDGQTRYVHQRGEVSVAEGGAAVRVTGTTQDVSERVQADEKLRLAANALENSAESVMISDANGRIVSVNKAFTTMTGYAAEEVVGRSPEFLRSDHHDAAFYEQLWNTVHRTGHWQGEIWGKRSNGEVYPQGISISAVKDASGRSTHYVSVSSDISRYKQYEARLAFLAHHDALTDLPNRFSFQTHLREALSRARRDGSVLALMFIDLDRFKIINDSLGHVVGDLALKAVAERLVGCVRPTDLVARLGGDEFVVVLDGVKSPQEAAKIADKLIAVLAKPFSLGGHQLSMSASIGISCFPQDASEADALLKNADAAMYRAKQLGRNACQLFCADMNANAVEQLVMTNSLRVAMSQQQFLLHYQPRMDLASRRVTGVEALVRWQHPELGLIAPAHFIPLAEETGLIGDLGEWVLRAACRQAKAWQGRGLPPLRVAVNLSARQFRQPDFARQVAAILAETGLDSSLLELEITESMVMQDLEKTRSILRELKALGIMIAIDDFGTGHSSLAYLKRFPVDYLKIDRSFVRDLPANHEDVAIAKAIIALGKSLDLCVIAEGVETPDQQSFLEQHGCDEAQGFLVSKPLAVRDMEAFLYAALSAGSPPREFVAA